MGITQADLEGCFEKYRSRHGGAGRKEDCFALLYLRDQFKKNPDELEPNVAWGGNDYGLDAFYLDLDRRNLYLFQFKWSKDHSSFKSSFDRLISSGMERIFGNPLQDNTQNDLLIRLKSRLNEDQAMIDRVLIHFVFLGDPTGAEHSAVLASLREDLESKKFLVDQFFNRKVDLAFEYRSTETHRQTFAVYKRTYEYTLPVQGSVRFDTPDNNNMFVCLVKLMDLYGMYKEMGPRFFERNFRMGLPSERPANRAIRQALGDIVLQEKTAPEVFTFNHNGVTVSVERIDVDPSEPGRAVVVEPRLLNGAQTITSLEKFLKDNERNPALRRNEPRLGSIRVLCKIIRSSSRDFVTDVTTYNNKQNKVDAWNLHANDLIQLSFQDKFARELGIYYERQERAFENLTDADLEALEIKEYKAIELKRLAQTFLAVQGEIDRMSHLAEVFESRKVYDETFKEGYLHVNSSKILFLYKVQFRLRAILDEIVERGPSKYGYVANARNLVWALLIQGLLNQDDPSYLVEQYGKTLAMERNYTDLLREIASRNVRFILSDVIRSEQQWKDKIENGEYGFLKTKAMFQRCMEMAYQRERWTKKSL
jgi:hypothetical protein